MNYIAQQSSPYKRPLDNNNKIIAIVTFTMSLLFVNKVSLLLDNQQNIHPQYLTQIR